MPPQAEPLLVPAHAVAPGGAPGGLKLGAYDTLIDGGCSQYHSVRLAAVQHTPLSAPFEIFDFDFNAPLDDPASGEDYARVRELAVAASADGEANAVAFWFTTHLLTAELEAGGAGAPADFCSYAPAAAACGARDYVTCWSQALQYLPRPLACAAGASVALIASHSPTRVTFSLPGDGKQC
jgi:type II protein arginine methyltransferase